MTLRWLRDRFTERPLDEHRMRTKWPTLFNPSTHLGMLKLAAITTKVILGQTVQRLPLSKSDAA
jgi:triacylglycerol lipase